MIESGFPFLEFCAAISACLSVYFYGNGSLKAPWVGLCAQSFWWVWTWEEELYVMMLLNFFMTVTHIRNIIVMKRRRHDD